MLELREEEKKKKTWKGLQELVWYTRELVVYKFTHELWCHLNLGLNFSIMTLGKSSHLSLHIF